MTHGFLFDIENMSKQQIKIAYDTEIKNYESEKESLNNLNKNIKTMLYQNQITEERIQEINQKLIELDVIIDKLKTELTLALI